MSNDDRYAALSPREARQRLRSMAPHGSGYARIALPSFDSAIDYVALQVRAAADPHELMGVHYIVRFSDTVDVISMITGYIFGRVDPFDAFTEVAEQLHNLVGVVAVEVTHRPTRPGSRGTRPLLDAVKLHIETPEMHIDWLARWTDGVLGPWTVSPCDWEWCFPILPESVEEVEAAGI
ncbi:MAG: hypothetical protein M5U28_14175 [Sandaracinaceae bacterium]|nr:hypothetical protein [Sandaracinaceae bacterium]